MVVCVGLAACRDDGGRGPDAADTTGGDTEADEDDGDDDGNDDDAADDDGNDDDPSGPSTDPDDTGPDPEDDGNDDDPDTGPADSSDSGDPTDPIDPEAFDDEFDGPLEGWSILNESVADISVDGGALHLVPDAWTVWVDGQSSTLVHRTIAGDFKVSAAVSVRSVQSPGSPPPPQYRFGGIMARDPSGNPENHVFIVLGTDDDPSVETKTTVNGASQWNGPPWPGGEGELRICRIGSDFRLYVREGGGAWQLQTEYARADLPTELQVGPIAYNYDDGAEVRASFQFIDFEPVDGPSDCTE